MTKTNPHEGTDFEEYLAERFAKHPEEKAAFEDLAPYFEIGAQLTGLRIKYDLTQKQLAAKIGVHQSEIARIENGQRNMSIKTMQKIARAFGGTVHIRFALPKS